MSCPRIVSVLVKYMLNGICVVGRLVDSQVRTHKHILPDRYGCNVRHDPRFEANLPSRKIWMLWWYDNLFLPYICSFSPLKYLSCMEHGGAEAT
jgi:hypothetical protein